MRPQRAILDDKDRLRRLSEVELLQQLCRLPLDDFRWGGYYKEFCQRFEPLVGKQIKGFSQIHRLEAFETKKNIVTDVLLYLATGVSPWSGKRRQPPIASPTLGSNPDPEFLRKYLGASVRNLLFDWCRSSKVRGMETQEDFEILAEQPERLVKVEEIILCREVLAQLAPHYRQILLLAYYAGHTTAEIAGILRISVPNVERQKKKALDCLRMCVSRNL